MPPELRSEIVAWDKASDEARTMIDQLGRERP
jgi:hypothetical protein